MTLGIQHDGILSDNYQFNVIVFNSLGIITSTITDIDFSNKELYVDVQTTPGDNICLLVYLTK